MSDDERKGFPVSLLGKVGFRGTAQDVLSRAQERLLAAQLNEAVMGARERSSAAQMNAAVMDSLINGTGWTQTCVDFDKDSDGCVTVERLTDVLRDHKAYQANESCGLCRFFSAPSRECRRHAPRGLVGGSKFPKISSDDWCGEFERGQS